MPGEDLPSRATAHIAPLQPSRNSASGLPQKLISLTWTLKKQLRDSRDHSWTPYSNSASGTRHLLLSPDAPETFIFLLCL